MRWKIWRAPTIALTMVDRPGAVRIRAAALRAASVAPLTAMPQSACLQGGRIVDAVAGHRDDMAALLQALDDLVFVLREHPAEAVGALDRVGDVGGITAPGSVPSLKTSLATRR